MRSTPSILADPPEFALANVWNAMKVGEIVYWYLKTRRARLHSSHTRRSRSRTRAL